MDGNHSLLDVVSQLTRCADAQPPLIINIALSLPANMCVMWLILAGPRDKAAEIFSLNQAVCEVAICMANVISLIAINTPGSNVAINTFLYYSIRFFWGFIFSGRPVFMTCICLDRYLAVVHPVTFLKYKPLRYRLAGTIISWLIVLLYSVTLIWLTYLATCYVNFSMAFTGFLVMFFCCVETLRALVRPGPGEGDQGSNGMNNAKLKAFKIILFLVVTTVLYYLPYVIGIIMLGHASQEYTSKLFCISAYAAVFGGLISPLLYIRRAGKLLHCIKDIV